MKILALENSTTHGSIALFDPAAEPHISQFENDRKHSGAFFGSLKKLADRTRRLDAIVVGLGPGSYAGVRIAIASAIGLKAASSAKLVGLPSICAMEPSPNEYYVIGDARRESFFFARVVASQITEGIDLCTETELRRRLETISRDVSVFASEKLPAFPKAILAYPSALRLGKLIEHGMVHSLETPLQPIYLREPHITIPNDTGKLPLLG
jgi:tRNA threonylcarbamoyl adenosine modification protein YeaZ